MPWRELTEATAAWDLVRTLPVRSGMFLQTPAWAQFQQAQGLTTRCLGWYVNGELKGMAQLVRHDLPFGVCYWLAPKGPSFAASIPVAACQAAQSELVTHLSSERPLFLRLEPAHEPQAGVRTFDENPRATSIVDLSVPLEQIFARMHEKTRYNIRLAERKGLRFHWAGVEALGSFWKLLQATAAREHFHTRRPLYHRRFELAQAAAKSLG